MPKSQGEFATGPRFVMRLPNWDESLGPTRGRRSAVSQPNPHVRLQGSRGTRGKLASFPFLGHFRGTPLPQGIFTAQSERNEPPVSVGGMGPRWKNDENCGWDASGCQLEFPGGASTGRSQAWPLGLGTPIACGRPAPSATLSVLHLHSVVFHFPFLFFFLVLSREFGSRISRISRISRVIGSFFSRRLSSVPSTFLISNTHPLCPVLRAPKRHPLVEPRPRTQTPGSLTTWARDDHSGALHGRRR